MTYLTHDRDRLAAIAMARDWLDQGAVFLDTETTGLDGAAQICDIALVDSAGQVLMNTLVKPTYPIPADAIAIHGITNQDVIGAPGWGDVFAKLRELLSGRLVVIYNAEYDMRLMYQSAVTANIGDRRLDVKGIACAMLLYAKFYGELKNRGGYRWQKLGAAMVQCGIDVSDGQGGALAEHRAVTDAEMCRRLVQTMAGRAHAGAGGGGGADQQDAERIGE